MLKICFNYFGHLNFKNLFHVRFIKKIDLKTKIR